MSDCPDTCAAVGISGNMEEGLRGSPFWGPQKPRGKGRGALPACLNTGSVGFGRGRGESPEASKLGREQALGGGSGLT